MLISICLLQQTQPPNPGLLSETMVVQIPNIESAVLGSARLAPIEDGESTTMHSWGKAFSAYKASLLEVMKGGSAQFEFKKGRQIKRPSDMLSDGLFMSVE